MLRRIVLLLLKKMPTTTVITIATTEALKKCLKKMEFFKVRPNRMQQERKRKQKLHICMHCHTKQILDENS